MWWHGESTVSSSSESHSVVSNSLQLHGLYSPWNSPGQNTEVGSLFLLQRIFPTLGSNLGLLNGRQILLPAEPQGKSKNTRVGSLAYPFSSGSSWPRNQTRVSCIAGGFFTNWAIREVHYHIYMYEMHTLSTLKSCNVMCQTYSLFKRGKKKLSQSRS